MTQVPHWTEEEFLFLLSKPELSNEELEKELPQQSLIRNRVFLLALVGESSRALADAQQEIAGVIAECI